MSTACLGSTEDERWCLSSSQNWTGSDIIYPDCTKTPSDPSCLSNTSIIDPETKGCSVITASSVCFMLIRHWRHMQHNNSQHNNLSTTQLRDSASSDFNQFRKHDHNDSPTSDNNMLRADSQQLKEGFSSTLLAWNKNILGLCDILLPLQYICASAPVINGTYTLAPPPLGTDADAGNQQRGGPGGVVTPCPTYTNSPTAAPGPTQTGIISSSNAYAMADNGIGCVDFAALNCIKTSQLFAWNGVLGANGENCGTSFWSKEYYCVGVSGSKVR
ncbi:hypothetical protein BDZ45DRAFT_806667 [Acephala macrosclerotiorum]|nr:hypothetical protein BDZ45DRAFT_806667 [Acephala macrosclerotiorum]